MNELEFLDAVGKIDDELLKEADIDTEYVPAHKISVTRRRIYALSSSAAAAVAIVTFALCNNLVPPELADNSSFTESGISYFTTSADNDNPASDATEALPEISENNNPTDSSAVTSITSDNKEPDTSCNTESSSETEAHIPETSVPNNDYDNFPPDSDFSGIPLEIWLENENVVWGTSDIKGSISSRFTPLGTSLISDELFTLMRNNPDNAVYAVLVDFSSCIDDDEFNKWEYNGNTIAGLKQSISEVTEYSDKSYTYVDSDGTEHTEYFLTSESEAKVKELQFRINEIKSAYYSSRISNFKETFHNNGLESYECSQEGYFQYDACFYCFSDKKTLENFICRDSEAFIFYPANNFK